MGVTYDKQGRKGVTNFLREVGSRISLELLDAIVAICNKEKLPGWVAQLFQDDDAALKYYFTQRPSKSIVALYKNNSAMQVCQGVMLQ